MNLSEEQRETIIADFAIRAKSILNNECEEYQEMPHSLHPILSEAFEENKTSGMSDEDNYAQLGARLFELVENP